MLDVFPAAADSSPDVWQASLNINSSSINKNSLFPLVLFQFSNLEMGTRKYFGIILLDVMVSLSSIHYLLFFFCTQSKSIKMSFKNVTSNNGWSLRMSSVWNEGSKASVKPTVIGLTVCPCGQTSAHQYGFLCQLKLHSIKSVSLISV